MYDLDPKVKVIGKKAGICDGVPSTAALVNPIFKILVRTLLTNAPVNLKMLCPMVQEKIHLQENTLFDLGVFDLDPKVKVT